MQEIPPHSPPPHLLRPTVLDVDLDSLVKNFQTIRTHVTPSRVMAILKANAYGHGLVACAKVLEEAGADSFGVAFLSEAVELRHAGITTPIVALGGISGHHLEDFLKHDIGITASSIMKLELIDQTAQRLKKKAKVHLKIDTGMERIGMHYYSAEGLFKRVLSCDNCEVESVFSHLATSEEADTSFARLQLERFLECVSFFEKHSLPMPLRHIANSGAILQSSDFHLDIVRPGLILYGVLPSPIFQNNWGLQPALRLRSEVVFFKVVEAGTGVSYDLTWTAPERTRVVTIPVGYGDGFQRRLSNKGRVLIRGKSYPIVGKICMDQLMVNIGPEGTAYNGDEAVLIGKQGEENISIEEVCAAVDTDPRDVLCSLNTRLPRCYSYRGKQ